MPTAPPTARRTVRRCAITTLIAALSALPAAGCTRHARLAARPSHDLPAGYSSTYRDALFAAGGRFVTDPAAVPPAPPAGIVDVE